MPDDYTLTLYMTHRRELVNYASRIVGDCAGAEDLVQDAWVLFDRKAQAAKVREPIAYLKRIVRNLAIDQVRRTTRQNTHGGAEMEAAARTVADQTVSPEGAVGARQEARLVMQVIDSMPARQRHAMRLYYFEGLKLREVAERLGVSRSMAHILVVDGLAICDERRSRGR